MSFLSALGNSCRGVVAVRAIDRCRTDYHSCVLLTCPARVTESPSHRSPCHDRVLIATRSGNDVLFVGIAGPKSQCEEVSVKHTGRNQFIINYWVQEKGRHYLMVKWGDRNIPGSPFIVDVL